jgi:hypothetical protein
LLYLYLQRVPVAGRAATLAGKDGEAQGNDKTKWYSHNSTVLE